MEAATDYSSQIYSFILPLIITILMGGIISAVYYIVDFLKDRLKARFTASVKLNSSDPLYQWVYDYMIEKNLLMKSLSNLSCKSERKSNLPFWFTSQDLGSDVEKPELSYLPSVGFHSFRYKGVTINVFHEVGKTMLTGYERKPTKDESLTLSCFGPWNIKILKSLCEEALQAALNKDQGKTRIYALKRYDENWEKVQTKNPRPFNTVILDSNIAEEIINDIQSFKSNQKWYLDRGIPYRRGYMLYGPPGTGKTSFVLAIAGELKLAICTLNLSGNDLDDDRLNIALENAPKNSIILLEDVDSIFVERTSVDESRGMSVSFSGLLNAIDGVRSQEGRILFMSTNHLEKLDPALLRPGRADVHVKLDFASQEQIKKMFMRFFPDCEETLAEKFMAQVPENKVSMARLQGHFLRNKNDPQKAIETAKSLIESQDFTEEMTITQWLFRLNLETFAPGFLKENLHRVNELKGVSSGDLGKFGITKEGDKKRIMNMITGEESCKKGFMLMSHGSMRALLSLFLKDNHEIERIVALIPENYITEFHLRDIFEQQNTKSCEKKVKEMLERVEAFYTKKKLPKTIGKKRVFPKETPSEMLERLGLQKYVEKFIEHDVLEPEIFFQLDEGALQEIEVSNYGLRKKLVKEIESVNEKWQEELNMGDQQDGQEFIVEKVEQILKKSTSIQY